MKIKFLFIIFLFMSATMLCQDKKFYLHGYVSDLGQVTIDSLSGDWKLSGTLQNKLTFKYLGIKNTAANISIRNRLLYGKITNSMLTYADKINTDKGYLDLSHNWSAGKSYIFNSAIDRLFIEYEYRKFKATLGRQRINWSKTYVWNPNDLFNNFSFFDFDYIEKSGSDALFLQYFLNFASAIEIAGKIDHDTNLTIASRYVFNKYKYDFQLVTGIVNQNDFVVGIGWEGNINDITFKGEADYLVPVHSKNKVKNSIIASTSLDYMFANGLHIATEFLFNQKPTFTPDTNNFNLMSVTSDGLRNLSIAKYSFATQLSYQFSPIFDFSVSALWLSRFNVFYLSPNIRISMNQNISLNLVGQFVNADLSYMNNKNVFISYLYCRLKYNF